MLIYHSSDAVRHDTRRYFRQGIDVAHPESVDRNLTLRDSAMRAGHVFEEAGDNGIAPIAAVHDQAYLDFLHQAWGMAQALNPNAEEIIATDFPRGPLKRRPSGLVGLIGYHSADTSTCIRAGTWAAAYGAAQAALSAAQAAETRGVAYALSRPPGHHAGADYSSGFCFLNNSAIAAHDLSRRHGKVAILDIDVHHGDGSQGLFYGRSDVLTVSVHGETSDFFPYFTGDAGEHGEGDGEGYNLNLPLARGSGDEAYLDAIRKGLDRVAQHDPAVVVIALGLDAADEDPVGSLSVTTEGFHRAASLIATIGRPTVLVQEGGYPCEALGRNLVAFLDGFSPVKA